MWINETSLMYMLNLSKFKFRLKYQLKTLKVDYPKE